MSAVRRVPERVAEHEVGEEHGREGEHHGQQVAQLRRVDEQALGRHQPGDRERDEQHRVQQVGSPYRELPVDEDGHQDAAEHAEEGNALTSQVVPNSRLKLTRLRVSSSRNAMPRTKKWGLNRRKLVPVAPGREADRDEGADEDDGQRHAGSSRPRSRSADTGTASHPWPAWVPAGPRRGWRRPCRRAAGAPSRLGHERAVGDGRHDVAVGPQQRLGAAERVREHGRDLGHQPWVAVVVVEHEDAVVGFRWSATDWNACSVNRNDSRRTLAAWLTSVSESGSANIDEVVLLVRGAQEGPPVVDVAMDPRVVVRAGRGGRSTPICWMRGSISTASMRSMVGLFRASASATSEPLPAPTMSTSLYCLSGNHL